LKKGRDGEKKALRSERERVKEKRTRVTERIGGIGGIREREGSFSCGVIWAKKQREENA
jgi:hypothetical protein